MLDPSDLTKEKSDGMRIRPEHIHTELRKKAGVDDTDAGNLFPIFPPEDPNIFG